MRRKCNDSRRTRGVVVRTGIIDLLAKNTQMVVVSRKEVTAIVALALNLSYDVKALVILQKLVFDIDCNALGIGRE